MITIINPKPLSEIRRERELNQLPMSDIYALVAQLNADFTSFQDHYFSKFPDQE